MEYIALLGNVDRSILKVDFGEGFSVESIKVNDFITFCKDNLIFYDVENKLDYPWCALPQYPSPQPEEVYVIKKHFNDHPFCQNSCNDLESRMAKFSLGLEFENSISNHINHKLNLLRLFGNGDIKCAFEAYYERVDGSFEPQSAIEREITSENKVFTISHGNLKRINQLINEKTADKLPKYINFSLRNFEKSYFTNHIEFDFLALMIALEAIFNDSNSEVTLRVSRGCAVLLTNNEKDANSIFKCVKNFYKKRSKLVHTGDTEIISLSDVLELRHIVRNVILKVIDLDLPKHKLSSKLLMKGFTTDL